MTSNHGEGLLLSAHLEREGYVIMEEMEEKRKRMEVMEEKRKRKRNEAVAGVTRNILGTTCRPN